MLHTLVTPSSLLPHCFPPHCVRTAISPPRRRSATFLALYYTDNFHPFSLPVSPARTIISSSRINCLLKYSNPLPQHAVVPPCPSILQPNSHPRANAKFRISKGSGNDMHFSSLRFTPLQCLLARASERQSLHFTGQCNTFLTGRAARRDMRRGSRARREPPINFSRTG